jgi:RHS repeat-associated protein
MDRLQYRSRFTGKERDAESGNDYFEARYYSSAMGRFMSPDWAAQEEPVPYANLDDPQSLNLYAYVENNPLARADADGHEGDGCCDFTFPTIEEPMMPPLPNPFHPLVPYSEEYTLTPEKLQKGLSDAGDAVSSFVQSTNDKLKKEWEKLWGKPWPKDADTGRGQEADHIQPKADGGAPNDVRNIQPLPQKDHRAKHKEDFKRWGKKGGKKPSPPKPDPPKPDPPKPDPPKPQGS